jgi:hypothetical protein
MEHGREAFSRADALERLRLPDPEGMRRMRSKSEACALCGNVGDLRASQVIPEHRSAAPSSASNPLPTPFGSQPGHLPGVGSGPRALRAAIAALPLRGGGETITREGDLMGTSESRARASAPARRAKMNERG